MFITLSLVVSAVLLSKQSKGSGNCFQVNSSQLFTSQSSFTILANNTEIQCWQTTLKLEKNLKTLNGITLKTAKRRKFEVDENCFKGFPTFLVNSEKLDLNPLFKDNLIDESLKTGNIKNSFFVLTV